MGGRVELQAPCYQRHARPFGAHTLGHTLRGTEVEHAKNKARAFPPHTLSRRCKQKGFSQRLRQLPPKHSLKSAISDSSKAC